MCNNCNCEAYDQCSIVGYLPVGFCCAKCNLYDEKKTCLSSRNILAEKEVEKIEPVETTIEGGVLRVVIRKQGKEIPLIIDLQKHLG